MRRDAVRRDAVRCGVVRRGAPTAPAPGPNNLFRAATHEATLRGMLVSSHFDLFPEWIGKASGLLADGTLRTEQTVVEGIEQAPDAFLGVLRGANTGKMLVRLAGPGLSA
ncbi:hypothetical protein [Streptomyces sp. NPDC057302]|uniref:hypothetical protein n=1 Tax=Streptomyces sp. NPDC057302 TaxID=3346094 RepID=UPI00363DB830